MRGQPYGFVDLAAQEMAPGCLLICFRTAHGSSAATCFGVVREGSVELDAVAFGGDIGTAAGLAEDADWGAVPRDFGMLLQAAGGRDRIGYRGFG